MPFSFESYYNVLFQWHALDRSEQAKYYEMARKEKELHLQLYPGWSARDNYAVHTKKKRKKKDIHGGEKGLYVFMSDTVVVVYYFHQFLHTYIQKQFK